MIRRCVEIPGLYVHLNSGIFLYPAYYLAFVSISRVWKVDYIPGSVDLVISYLIFILGSDLPDVDHKDAPIRLFVEMFLMPLVFVKVLEIFTRYLFQPFTLFLPDHLSLAILMVLAVAVAFLALKGVMMLTKHRGFFHSLSFAFLYGAIVFFFAYSLLHGNLPRLVFISTAGTCGVVVHLLLDVRGRIWRMKLW